MGSNTGLDDEKPQHRLHLDEFYIARVPITNAQYDLFVQATEREPPSHWEDGRPPKQLESHPVTHVTWHDALAYCRWLGQVTGKNVSLPSEAEWEKAARGDKEARTYPWGDTYDRLRCNGAELGLSSTTPVGIFPDGASPYGVLDMSGNVWEWTRSLWGKGIGKPNHNYPYHVADGREDMMAGTDVLRVLRGGAFYSNAWSVRCAVRHRLNPYFRSYSDGFRVMVSPLLTSDL
jgi:formylglycine-generating enzyme required for sulfatase activity